MQEKLGSVQVYNHSELPATIVINSPSTIIRHLNALSRRIVIPPLSPFELRFSITPRRPNSEYRKCITLVNVNNSRNNQSLIVVSNNVDYSGLSFHALFYKVSIPSTNLKSIEFQRTVLDGLSLRSLFLTNISSLPVRIKLQHSGSHNDVHLYVLASNISLLGTTTSPSIASSSLIGGLPSSATNNHHSTLSASFENHPSKRSVVAVGGVGGSGGSSESGSTPLGRAIDDDDVALLPSAITASAAAAAAASAKAGAVRNRVPLDSEM